MPQLHPQVASSMFVLPVAAISLLCGSGVIYAVVPSIPSDYDAGPRLTLYSALV